MTYPIYTTRQLLGVMRDTSIDAPSSFFLDNFFPGTLQSTREEILFEKITGRRKVAPFVRPTSVGQPTFTRKGSKVNAFRPAYVKPKDVIRPSDQLTRQPGDLFTDTPRTPEANFNAEVAEVAAYHRALIERRWEVMAAKATINGEIDIEYEDGSVVNVDFDRDPNHTVLKNSNYWTTGYDILGDIQLWADRMTAAEFGGIPTDLIVAPDVWAVMRANTVLKDQMDLNFRGGDVDIKRGLVFAPNRESRIRFVGTLGEGLNVWVYNDYYQDDNGNPVSILPAKEILLIDRSFGGVKAFGAIVDKAAALQPLPMFPKMWDQEDPSATNLMTQSAPLMIPVDPNKSLRARVFAA